MTRRALQALCAQYGATFTSEPDGRGWVVYVDAPVGKVWELGSHCLVSAGNNAQAAYADMIERLQALGAPESCDDPYCVVCPEQGR